jgi:hypothetical protein
MNNNGFPFSFSGFVSSLHYRGGGAYVITMGMVAMSMAMAMTMSELRTVAVTASATVLEFLRRC